MTHKMVSPFKKRRKSPKPKPKPVISYPPVATRTWIPPDERPKKPRPAPYKPTELNQKLALSSLKKVWHNFDVHDDRAVLVGNFSQTHKRFSFRSNGHQAPCNCVAAIAHSKLLDMPLWSTQVLDKILDLGDRLYVESSGCVADKSRKDLKLSEVYHTFYVDLVKVTVDLKATRFAGKVSSDLKKVLQDFLSKNDSAGVLVVLKRYFAIWTSGKGFYLFDPTEHDDNGSRWSGLPGLGHCLLLRLSSISHLVDAVKTCFGKDSNPKFVLVPCTVLRKLQVNTDYPECLASSKLETKPVPSKVTTMKPGKPKAPSRIPLKGKAPESVVVDAIGVKVDESEVPPEGVAPRGRTTKPRIGFKPPIDKPKAQSVTYFRDVLPEKVGILRALTHQSDPKFTRYSGRQSLANATAAVAMLRKFRSRHWTTYVLDEILKLGDVIYRDSTKALPGDQTLKVTALCKRIALFDELYEPEIEEYSAVGKLGSLRPEVLDLPDALKVFFGDNDACILRGPVELAVWVENQHYYMFDPNERDKNGLAVLGAAEPGYACVTWFKNLRDLVQLYVANVPRDRRRDRFALSKIQVKDYVELPEPWNQFRALSRDKWILSGNFSQNDGRYRKETRNTQCTANATMAIIMSALVPVDSWTGETLDDILDGGDEFYACCVRSLQEKGKFVSRLLMVDELLKAYSIGEKQINLEIDDCLVNGNLCAPDDEKDVPNLKVGMRRFFDDSDAGVLTCRSLSMAVWKLDDAFYYFDSHSRDENGISCVFGTSCVVRTNAVETVTDAILANLGAGVNALYNLSRVEVKIYVAGEDGGRPLNNYAAVDERTAILRAAFSEHSPRFKSNRGRQTVSNSIVAFGMAQVYPTSEWTTDILGEVLVLGDKLYAKSMETLLRSRLTDQQDGKSTEEVATESQGGVSNVDDDSDDITSNKVVKTYKIGVNRFGVELGEPQEGQLFELKEVLTNACASGDDRNEMLLECEQLTMAMWKEDGLWYAFDPKPRDAEGCVYGRDDWSTGPPSEQREEEENEDEEEDEGAEESGSEPEDKESEGAESRTTEVGAGDAPDEASAPEVSLSAEESLQLGEEEEVMDELIQASLKEKHSSHYWRELRENEGRACVMLFADAERLVEHVVDNVPVATKGEAPFRLIPIKITNRPDVKNVHDREVGVPPVDDVAGDWHEFKEVEYGRWILRGSMDQTNALFPSTNRGRQCAANCFAALAFGKLYSLSKFKSRTVDHILMYGDRLFTFTRNAQKNELKLNKDLGLNDDEIDAILENESYDTKAMTKRFSLGGDTVVVTLTYNDVVGDVNSDDSDVPDVLRGLQSFFEQNRFGILDAKDLLIAVWRSDDAFYMFDQNSRGPSGLKCVNGVACITRYKKLGDLVDVFVRNLTRDGGNGFSIHLVDVAAESPVEVPKSKAETEAKQTAVTTTTTTTSSAKSLVRGNISQEHPMFARAPNSQSAPIALVALAMSLVHKSACWTKPIVDEVVVIGDELYAAALDALGFDFNPWEQRLTLDMVPTDFKVGELRACCHPRTYHESGVMNARDSHGHTLNLRQGMERFFEENSHGVVVTEHLQLAIWREAEPAHAIYMFDPYPRGATGMPLPATGKACVLRFDCAKAASDHFASLVPPAHADCEFEVVPMEVCVGKVRTKTKKQLASASKTPLVTAPKEAVTPSEKRKQRELEMQARKEMETQRAAKLGLKEFYKIPGHNVWIVRGTKDLHNKRYSPHSRGLQDIPVCLTSFVMEHLFVFPRWTHKVIDMILDVGDQLYKDSCVAYKPTDKKLGLGCVVRDIVIKNVHVKIAIGRPVLINHFNVAYLEKALDMFFRQRSSCMISINDNYVAVFFKDGFYYAFVPHAVDLLAERTGPGRGASALLKFEKLIVMCERIFDNYNLAEGDADIFSIIVVTIKSTKKYARATETAVDSAKLV